MVFSYVLYFIAVKAAEDFSFIIMAAFDLYRFDLIKQLRIKMPDTLEQEKRVWKKIDRFIREGELFQEAGFTYAHTEEKTQVEEPKDSN